MDQLINFFRRFCFPRKDIKIRQLKEDVYAITALRPNNLSLYRLALQHSSAKIEQNSNERLEFLGDAVLSLVVAEYLFKKYPLQEEGFLTEIRSRIVNRASLGELAKKIGMDELLRYDTRSVNQHNTRFVYGNALEAFIGAVYLDQGYTLCAKFIVESLLKIHIDLEELVVTDNNYKSKIIAWAQKHKKGIQFTLINEKRVQGTREFVIQLFLEGEVHGEGMGKNKKQAEQMAANEALKKLNLLPKSI